MSMHRRSILGAVIRVALSLPAVAALLTAAPTAAAQTGEQPSADAEPRVLYSSSLWTEKAEAVEGQYTIIEENGKHFIELSRDFATERAPDLKIVLSPLEPEWVRSRDALGRGSVVVAELKLKSAQGEQRFEIPASADLATFKSVLIHCEQYTKLWAAAPLSEGELLHRGDDWTRKGERVRGHWEIARTSKGHELRIGADFRTKNAPDLKFVLSPRSARDVSSRTALENAEIIAPLRSASGAQVHAFPESVDPSQYDTLLIHCERYTKLWAVAALR